MITKVFRFMAGAKTKIIIASVIFIIGVATGAWLYNKIYAYGKIKMLEDYAERLIESNKKTIDNLTEVHKKQIEIAKDEVKIERIKEYVKDNRECDINSDTEQLLNASRTGLSIASPGADGTAIGFTPITQRQQIESCAKDGIQYRKLKVRMIGLQQFLLDNWYIPK